MFSQPASLIELANQIDAFFTESLYLGSALIDGIFKKSISSFKYWSFVFF
jgi:hypothetical protein